jgi:DNA-binding LytR/AlgR family response regulator
MTALIIEDEDIIAEVLKTKIRDVAPDVHVAEVLPSLKAARKWFGSQPQPDILFMDIQLSDGISFELLETHTFTCPIIFTTAYDEYAIRAFKVNSVDYLLKPVDEEELKRAIEKAKEIIQLKQPVQADLEALLKALAQPQKNIPKYKEKFIVNIRNQWKPVDVKEIACFVKEVLNYVCLFNGEKYPLNYTTLDEIEELLDPGNFFRANRQFIIHIDAIQSVKSLEYSKLMVKLKEPNHKFAIEMSRDKAPLFKKWVDR